MCGLGLVRRFQPSRVGVSSVRVWTWVKRACLFRMNVSYVCVDLGSGDNYGRNIKHMLVFIYFVCDRI